MSPKKSPTPRVVRIVSLPITLMRTRNSPCKIKYIVSPGSPCFTIVDHWGALSTSMNCANRWNCSSLIPPRILTRRHALHLSPPPPPENLPPPQRPRIDPADALDCDATRNSIRFRTKEHLKLGDLRRFLPGTGSCCENPRIRRDSLILDPRYQRWQLDRAIGRLVDTPDNKVCITRGHG